MNEKEKDIEEIEQELFIKKIKEMVKDVSEEEKAARFAALRNYIFGTSEKETNHG